MYAPPEPNSGATHGSVSSAATLAVGVAIREDSPVRPLFGGGVEMVSVEFEENEVVHLRVPSADQHPRPVPQR